MSLTITAQKRDAFGKNASYRIRRDGRVPAVLYGEGLTTVTLALDKKDIIKILKSDSGENTLFQVGFDGELRNAMIKSLQVDPVSDELLHVDLIQISMDKAIRVAVPVEHTGEPIGVKTEGGFVDFITRELEIECLPKDIPEKIAIDISGLHLHQSIKAAEVVAPPGVKIISDPQTVLILIQVPHEEKVEEKKEGEEVAAAEEAKEPEVIKKERASAEDEKDKDKDKERDKDKGKERDKDKGKEKKEK
jgi:large subunit ribosomal protein L25